VETQAHESCLLKRDVGPSAIITGGS
jgi:hypothetical protein